MKVAIADPNEATHNTRLIQQLAGNAVANGMPWADAFAAITSVPAAIYGRTDLGSLKSGAIADVVIWDSESRETPLYLDDLKGTFRNYINQLRLIGEQP